MDLKGLPYRKVEVNPYSKKELPELPEGTPRKVPVLQFEDRTVQDSTDILAFLEQRFDGAPSLLPADAPSRDRAKEIEDWVDTDLTQVLPTVIYGTWGEAAKAAQVTAKSSNFGPLANVMVRAGGSLIMHQIAKRIVKKRGGGDPHEMLGAELDRLEAWLGDSDYVCGDRISLGDAAAHGALTCIKEFPAFARIVERPRLAAWYDRVANARAVGSAAAAAAAAAAA